MISLRLGRWVGLYFVEYYVNEGPGEMYVNQMHSIFSKAMLYNLGVILSLFQL